MWLDLNRETRFDLQVKQDLIGIEVFAKAPERRPQPARLEHVHFGAETWLQAAVTSFSNILEKADLIPPAAAERLIASADEMLGDMSANRVDVANLTNSDLGLYASPDAALKLSTLHNAKGREFDAVAMIDLHDGRIPFFLADTQDQPRIRCRPARLCASRSSWRSHRLSRWPP